MPEYPIDPYTQPGPLPEAPNTVTPEQPVERPVMDAEQLKSWWLKVRASEDLRREQLEKSYERAINYFKSKQGPGGLESDEYVVVNYIAPTVRLILSSTYPRHPDIRAKGRNPLGKATGPIAENALNYYNRETEVEEENQLVFIDALLAGEGVSLEAHSSQLVYAKEPKKETAFPVPEGKESDASGEEPNKKPDEVQYAEYIKKSIPLTFRISPKDFVRDSKAKSLIKARWCGRRINEKPIEEVLDNPLYRKEAQKKLEGLAGREAGKTVNLYELQVKRRVNGEIELWRLVLCEEAQDEYLYYAKEVYEGEGFNYNIIQPNKLGDDVYALSEFNLYVGPQDQLNQIHSKIREQISKSMTQPVINEDALTKKGKTAFLRGSGPITVKTGMNPAGSALTVVETSRVHPDLYRYEAITRDVFRVVGSIGENMRAGIQQGGTETLGELQMIQGGSNLALSHFTKSVRKFLIRQARKKLQIIRQFNTEEEYLPILGNREDIPKQLIEGEFFKFSSTYIRGEYDLEIDLNTMKQYSDEAEKANFERMVKGLLLLEAGLAREGKRLKYFDLGKEWLKRFEIYSPASYFEDLNLRTPDEEDLAIIAMATTGNIMPFDVQEGEDLDTHLQKHLQFAQSPLKKLIPPEVWTGVLEPHIAATLQAVEQKKQQEAKVVQRNA